MSTSRRDKREQLIAERTARIMADTRFQRLRTRPARMGLATAMVVLLAVIPATWILLGGIAGVIAVIVGAVVWWLLRMSVRLIADLPEEHLDERQSEVRNRGYVEAYRWLGGLVVVVASAGVISFIVLGEDPDTWKIALNYNTLMGLFWMLEGAALSIPSIVLAVRDREPLPISD
jgi:hypothetical protein